MDTKVIPAEVNFITEIDAGILRLIAVQEIQSKLLAFVRYQGTKPPLNATFAEGEVCLIDGRKFRLTVEAIK
jgi:hypothetical protein